MARNAMDGTLAIDRAVLAMLLAACLLLPPHASPRGGNSWPLASAVAAPSPATGVARVAPWAAASAPREVIALVDSVLAAQDNGRRPFLVIDKGEAQLYVIDAAGRLAGRSAVLLGAARGDDSVPGIGERAIAAIRPAERTTPAGRFEAAAGQNAQGEDIVWVDYDAAISMHRVRVTNPHERRLERLVSTTAADHRISYGCINVPASFFDEFVGPLFRSGPHAVYILPEVKTSREVFGSRLDKHAG